MKKNLYVLMALLVSCSLMFSCSDSNNDPDPELGPGPDPTPGVIGPDNVNGLYGDGTGVVGALSLSYSDEPLLGKQVNFNTSDKEKATIVLYNVIPGEATTTLSDIELVGTETQFTFGSTTTTQSGWSFTYKGSVEKDKMSLELSSVKMPENSLTGTWSLDENSPLHIDWISGKTLTLATVTINLGLIKPTIPVKASTDNFFADIQSTLDGLKNYVSAIGDINIEEMISGLLGGVLGNVSFLEDGNIIAEYSKSGVDGYLVSPKNLVHYYIDDADHIRVILNPTALFEIIDLSGLINGEGNINMEDLNSLLTNLSDLLVEGISLGYRADNTLQVYVEQDLFERLLAENLVYDLLSGIEYNETLYYIVNIQLSVADILEQLPDIFEATTTFELGLLMNQAE